MFLNSRGNKTVVNLSLYDEDVEGLLMMDVTGVYICWACLSAIKETFETFKLRDYQRDQPQGHYSGRQVDLQRAFKQEKADGSNSMHNSKCRPNNDVEIRWRRFS